MSKPTDKTRIIAAMGTIMAYLCDEDILDAWLEWGIEDEADPSEYDVLEEDFESIAEDFARLVRRATAPDKRGGKPNCRGWLYVPETQKKEETP